MALINVNNITISFSETDVLSNVSFQVEEKNKIGLVGANGAGKTTLFKIITKEYYPNDGTVTVGKDTKIGYMEQHACASSNKTMLDELMTVFGYLYSIEDEVKEIENNLSENDPKFEDKIERLNFLHTQYERLGGLTYHNRARSALLGLGFEEKDFSLPCSLLSGGQRSKLSLCKLLLSEADFLLLDEPTNHLDIESVNWLESWLKEYNGSFIVISHDRYFLDKVTNRTFEIERGKFYCADRNYSGYIKLKEERRKSDQKVYDATMKEVHRIEGMIEQQKRFNRERNYITIASKQKSIDRLLENAEKPESELGSINFNFTSNSVSGNDVLMCSDLSKSFGTKKLFEKVDLHIKRGERVFLVGENGCGKSTLLKIILGQIRRDSGRVNLGVGVKIGYFDQTLAELSTTQTVIDEVWNSYKKMNETQIRNSLAAFLFKGDDVFKVMNTLSGGEKARVALLKLMLSGSNFLILDEPTNHLDIKSREALEKAFDTFDGTMLIVSHDRYFINRLANRIIKMKTSGVDSYIGNYDYYIEHKTEEVIQAKAQEKPKENDYKKQKERGSEIRKMKGRISRLEAEIDSFDEKISALQDEINNPDNSADYEKILSLTDELHKLSEEQEEKMLLWQELSEQLEEMTGE